MGHRANYVLIRQGQARAFYDHWGALACTLMLEEGAVRLEKSVPKMGEAIKELMDWGFAEGGFLIDYDEKICIAFGSPDVDMESIPEEYQEESRSIVEAFDAGWPAFVEHIKKGWRGYQMIWDERGVDAFAVHLERRKITSIKTQPPSHPASLKKTKPEVVAVPESAAKSKASKAVPAKPKKKPR